MTIRNISDAKEQLSALIVQVEAGEEVIIARSGKPVAKLVRFERASKPRTLGLLKGKVKIAPNFDEPDQQIEKLFGGGPIEPTS